MKLEEENTWNRIVEIVKLKTTKKRPSFIIDNMKKMMKIRTMFA